MNVNLLVGLGIFVGLVGVAVPLLPGLLLVWASVATWSVVQNTAVGWTVLAVATALVAVGQVIKYAVPGQRLRRAGVATSTLLAGVLAAIVGFFVVPVVGLVLGFVGGVFAAQWLQAARRRDGTSVHPASGQAGTRVPGGAPSPQAVQPRTGEHELHVGEVADLTHLSAREEGWATTVLALKAVGLAILIELATGLLVAGTWVAGVLLG